MRARTFLAIVLAPVALAGPSFAQPAADYVFNVPVRIENTPPLGGRPANVTCTVTGVGATGSFLRGGSGSTAFTIGPAGYRETVRVEVTLIAIARRENMRAWQCELLFNAATTARGVEIFGGMTTDRLAERYTTATGQAVASHVVVASGRF